MKLVDDRTATEKTTHPVIVMGTDSFMSGWGESGGGSGPRQPYKGRKIMSGIETIKTKVLLEIITGYQNIQKRNPMESAAWIEASKNLRPLFAEMARRQNKVAK